MARKVLFLYLGYWLSSVHAEMVYCVMHLTFFVCLVHHLKVSVFGFVILTLHYMPAFTRCCESKHYHS